MTTKINRERLADLEAGKITLDRDQHISFEDGHCAMEVVAWLADQDHTDVPSCSSRVLGTYTIRLNDQWDTKQRQKLVPFLPRLVGTADDGQDEARSYLALDWLIRTFTPTWLDLAGFTKPAATLRNLNPITDPDTARAAAELVYAAQAEVKVAKFAIEDDPRDDAMVTTRLTMRNASREAAMNAARDTAGEAAWDVAWDAAINATQDATRVAVEHAAWNTAWTAAWAAAWPAVKTATRTAAPSAKWSTAWTTTEDALAPTVEVLQASALDLLDRMIDPSKATQ